MAGAFRDRWFSIQRDHGPLDHHLPVTIRDFGMWPLD